MLSQNILMFFVLIIIIIAMIYYAVTENFCNCTGMGARTANPTYYVYRPFGDVSNYGNDYLSRASEGQFITVGAEEPLAPYTNLGWKTGMPYDAFVKGMTENNWAAGSDPQWKTHSSVPMLASGCMSGDPNMVHKSNNGGYATNYGSSCGANANNMSTMNGMQFMSGQYGFPNMLSNGKPDFVGPAGTFTDSIPCGMTANAYNLGVGVL
jgi:hypothetical protein